MHTKDYLAQELRKAGLEEMAKKAETGYYHDFLSPLPLPCLQLAIDLKAVGSKEADVLREKVMDGEFDASREEGDEWIKSPAGQETLSGLTNHSRAAKAKS